MMKRFPCGLGLSASLAPLLALATLGLVSVQAQSTYTYSSTTSGNSWGNSSVWSGGPASTAPGVGNNPNSLINGTTNDIAVITNLAITSSSGTMGPCMSASAATGTGNFTGDNGFLSLGAIELTMTAFTSSGDASKTNLGIGEISNSVSGVMQLNGATLALGSGTLSNVLIAVADGTTKGLYFLQAAGGGTGVLQLQLGNTNGTFYVTTNQSLTLELNLLQAQTNTGFTKAGAGTLTLGGSVNAQNECSGPITLNAGTYSVTQSQTAGVGVLTNLLIINGGTFSIATASPGIGSVNVNSNATIFHNEAATARTYSWTVNLYSDLSLGSAGGPVTWNTNPWTLYNGTRTLTTSTTNFTIASAIGDGGDALGLTKAGSSTLILTATNTYTGPTTVSAGSLMLGAGGVLNSPNIIVAGGATYDVSLQTAAGYSLLSSGQTLAGTGTSSSGAIVLPAAGANLGSGSLSLSFNSAGTTPTFTVNGGQLNLSNQPVTVTIAGSALVGSSGGTPYLLVSAGTGSLGGSVASSTLTVAGAGLAANNSAALSLSAGQLYLVVTSSTTPTKLQVETAPDGSGSVVPAEAIMAGNSLTVYSIARTANNTFVANVFADWSLTNTSGGVVPGDLVAAANGLSATFTGHLVGTATINAQSPPPLVLSPGNSGVLTVEVGSPAAVLVETAANGSGVVVPAQAVNKGSSVTGYAIVRDGQGNFVNNVAASWSLVNITGSVVNGDLVPAGNNQSATFTVHGPGTANIQANSGGLAATTSGTITALGSAITWVGDGVNNYWDHETPNWSGGQLFVDGDLVLFNDSGSENPPVYIAEMVSPDSLTVNAAGNYTFTGNGSINGITGLTNLGTGTLTMQTANGYTGVTEILQGVVNVQNSTGLGVGSVVVGTNSAELQLEGGLTLSNMLTLNGDGVTNEGGLHSISGLNFWGGSITLASASRINADADTLTLDSPTGITGSNTTLSVGGEGSVTILNQISTGTGTLIKDGSGTLLLGSNGLFSGGVIVSNGTLQTTNSAGYGTGTITLDNGTTLSMTDSSSLAVNVTNPITLAAGASASLDGESLAATFDGNITGNSDSTLIITNQIALLGNTTAQLDSFQGTVDVTNLARLRWAYSGTAATMGSISPDFIVDGIMEVRNNGNTVLLGSLSGAGTLTGNAANANSGNTTYVIGGKNKDTTFSGNIANGSSVVPTLTSVVKVGSGTLALDNYTTYSAGTIVSNGTLLVNGSVGNVLVSGGTLGGNGSINGFVTNEIAGTIEPGTNADTGVLSIDGSLDNAGNMLFKINKSLSPPNDSLLVYGTLTNEVTGTLTVTNLGPALVVGDTFSLFIGGTPGANMIRIIPPPGVTLLNNLAVNGSIQVTAVTQPPPQITSVKVSGGNVILAGINGPTGGGYTYYVCSSTNLTTPLTNWTTVATNLFNSDGSYTCTIAQPPGVPHEFYVIKLP
jgi:autotransporter-associated beta strand protein